MQSGGNAAQDLRKLIENITLTFFKLSIHAGLIIYSIIDGIIDEYEDESGVDVGACSNQVYDNANKLYSPNYSAAKTVTAFDNAQIDTAQSKFGGASGLFDGTNDYLSVPDSADWNFGVGDFTIDFWVKSNDISIRNGYCGQNVGGVTYWRFLYQQEAGTLSFINTINNIEVKCNWVPNNNWYHIAIVRNAGVISLYIDGVSQALTVNTNPAADWGDHAAVLTIGQVTGGDYLPGWIDEFRISKGIARWVADFAPPIAEYVADTYTKLLLHCNGIDGSTTFTDSASLYYAMTLLSLATVAMATPNTARIILLEEDVDAITLNTDLLVYASRDNGVTWTLLVLADEGFYFTGKRILSSGAGSLAAQPVGTNMKYKIVTANNKNFKIKGASLQWA